MADSLRLQILKARVAQLSQPSVTVGGVTWARPAGLTASLSTARPLVTYPACVVSVLPDFKGAAETVEFLAMGRQMESTLFVDVQCRAAVAGQSPEEATDPMVVWVDATLAADPTLGGLAMDAHPRAFTIDAHAGQAQGASAPNPALATRTEQVRYSTRQTNPAVPA